MNKVLIYDTDCPLCRVYTKGLVVAGALPPEARQSNDSATVSQLIGQLDPVRSKHEIPLLDLETGETQYGVDAVLTLLGTVWPRFSQFVRRTVLVDVARKLYAFISYNRRIIVPATTERWHIMDLTPDFSVAYRISFLVLLYGSLLVSHLSVIGHVNLLALLALVGQTGWSGAYIVRHSAQTRLANSLDYAGHLGMSLLLGGIFKATGAAIDVPALTVIGNAVMIWQHIIRLRVMKLPDYLNLPFIAFVLLNH
ncbi:hypothetical protein [Fibrella forsythiae]|uniref:DUF393 domain-containing protein n=1 Tax=Fibrella forsythiae TaxID=2817061 RepID=A0ABS3JNF8_9BACT|nr:hypothetical protein [Fibrella forsythiae]MBO0951013.1 hypothetical protein [Fibrella forsythiae]